MDAAAPPEPGRAAGTGPAHAGPPPFAARIARVVLGLAVAALAAHAAHALTGIGGGGAGDELLSTWIFNGLIVVSALCCAARAAVVRHERAAWALVALGLGAWAAGELYYELRLSSLETPPYPSLSDALALAFYPATYAAIVLLARSRLRGAGGAWLDGVVAALAIAAIASAVLFDGVLAAAGGDLATAVTDFAYPFADVLLLAVVAAAVALTGYRPARTWALIGAALATAAVADGLFLFLLSRDAYAEGSVIDALWPASTLLLAYAAWQRPEPSRAPGEGGMRLLVFSSVFALSALGLLLFDHYAGVDDLAIALAGLTLVAVIARLGIAFQENLRLVAATRTEALTDALTGLGNRRRLLHDLERMLAAPAPIPHALLILDLDGFKRYNDTYGHPAGDALLARLGGRLEAAVHPLGMAYRMGGDEFCALVPLGERSVEALALAAGESLAESGTGFEIHSSCGWATLPEEAADCAAALRLADRRLYARKGARPDSSASRQAADALLQAIREREPDLHGHVHEVAELARSVGQRLGLTPAQLETVVRAADLHDVGKMAMPDPILRKPGALDAGEWAVMRQHTLVGERILAAAPALEAIGRVVRSSHERWDGGGYPDGLAGDAIPLGARIVAVCDAFHAITSDRPYRRARPVAAAVAELRRCAGGQFDPLVVELLCEEVAARAAGAGRLRAVEDAPQRLAPAS